jgi:hypothetical protein
MALRQNVAVAAAQQGQDLQLTTASQQQQYEQVQQEEPEQQAQALRDAGCEDVVIKVSWVWTNVCMRKGL